MQNANQFKQPCTPRGVARRWSKTAVDCYNRGCRCVIGGDECGLLWFCSKPTVNYALKRVVRLLVEIHGIFNIPNELGTIKERNDVID